jgi:hypothetical protein
MDDKGKYLIPLLFPQTATDIIYIFVKLSPFSGFPVAWFSVRSVGKVSRRAGFFLRITS